MTIGSAALSGAPSAASSRRRVDYWFLLRELVKRDFQSRYAGSLLGGVWALLQPLWQLLLFVFVFSIVLTIDLGRARTDNFAIFLFAAFIPWIAISEGIGRATSAITDSAELVKKLSFPPALLVVTALIGGLLQSAWAALVFLPILAVTGEGSWSSLWLLLLAIPLQIALTAGLGLGLAALHVFFRDVQQLVTIGLNTWFYLTPVIYPLAAIPNDTLANVIRLNPLTGLVTLYRAAFLGGGVEWLDIASLPIAGVVLLLLGVWIFRTLRPAFPDEI